MDHQFSEEEAREVFARAAERQHAVGAREGLSLDELRAIGREAGLDAEHVEAAARAVAAGEPETGRRAVGPVPTGVFRTAVLPGPPSDALWAEIVADARRTFSAQGKVSESGRLKQWRNGNLRVTLEPAGDGASRLHLETRRTDRSQLVVVTGVAAAVLLVAAWLFSLDAFQGGADVGALLMVGLGSLAGSLGFGTEQRRWADARERQFDQVARRAALAAEPFAREPAPEGRIDPALLDADAELGPSTSADRRRVR